MTATTPEEAEFLKAIAADPADDTARLVYADWLDEYATEIPGRDPDEMRGRAELIRVQCELAGLGRAPYPRCSTYAVNMRSDERCLRCESCQLVSRETALLTAYEADWRRAGPCAECNGSGNAWGHSTTYPKCGACDGTGDVGALTGRTESGEWARKVTFDRGFPGTVHATFDEVFRDDEGGEYEPTRRALAWMRHPTVTRVVLADREPYHNAVGAWIWVTEPNGGRDIASAALPPFLYAALRDDIDIVHRGFAKAYRTRAEVIDALAAAVCEVLRNWKG